MPHPVLRPELVRRIEEQVGLLDFECVDVLFVAEGGRRILRVTLDSPGGVLLDQCAKVSRELSPVLDEFGDLPGGYCLEVSSPGINRPLTKPEHFRRFRGERVKVRLNEKLDGGLSVTGILGELENDVLTVETPVGTRKVPLSQIARARLHRDLDAFLKPGRDRSV
ncbi:MAG: ribosome maturation factor RimP [Candidatus Krumholzibacteriia bacterium]